MGGRLLDWLGAGAQADRPVAADMIPDGKIPSGSAAVYFGNDDKILNIFDETGPTWFEIDVAAVAALMFQSLPDVDWSTPPTDGQIFEWDTTSGKLIPINKPNQWTIEDIQDLVGAMISNSSGMNVTYDDGLGQLVFASLIFQYTDELAQDAIAAAIAAGTHTGMIITYDDATNKFSFEVSATYIESVVNTLSVDELSDVDTTTVPPTNGQILKWDSVAGKWKPGVASTVGSINDLSDVDTATAPPANGNVLVWNSTSSQWEPKVGGSALTIVAAANDLITGSATIQDYYFPKQGAAAQPNTPSHADNLKVSFTMTEAGWVTIDFDAIINRTTGLVRVQVVDAATGNNVYPTRVTAASHENFFHSYSSQEGNGQQIHFNGAVYCAAGTYNWVVKYGHVNTAVATIVLERTFRVTLPASARIITPIPGSFFRGARVKKAADQTAANFLAVAPVAWDAEDFDSHGFHDNVTNNSRLYVPVGSQISRVIVTANLVLGAITSGTPYYAEIHHVRGATDTIVASDHKTAPASTDSRASFSTGPVEVLEGDYFYVALQCGDTSITVFALSRFSILAVDLATTVAPSAGSGTAFPPAPADGDRFYRTDRKIEYYWDATAGLWLSTTLNVVSFQSLQNIAVTSTFYQMIPHKAAYSIYLEKWQTAHYLAATGVWDIRLEYDNSANVATILATNSTSGDAATTWINKEANIGAVLNANARNLRINGVKTSGGNLYGTGCVSYRLVG